ncbi:MAG: hypothetical protein CBC06_008950 [bacterium TMED46]|nr:MAG: hypothetical protein CBC06_008950 [bacterium TMED46]
MSTRYNNRRIIRGGQKIAPGKLLPGMILTFNYSEKGVKDPRPILLFLYNNNSILEGININYLNPTKLKKLFSVIEFKKGKLEEEENLIFLKEDYFRIQISNPKKRSAMSPKRFYSDVILSDKYFKDAYRSYKAKSLTSLLVSQINTEFIT